MNANDYRHGCYRPAHGGYPTAVTAASMIIARMTEIGADVTALNSTEIVARVIVSDGNDRQSPMFEIWTDGLLIFSAPLSVLAWQLAIMEPKLARFMIGTKHEPETAE